MGVNVFGVNPDAIQRTFIEPSDFSADARVYNFLLGDGEYALLKPPINYPFLSVFSTSLLYFRLLDSDESGEPLNAPSSADAAAELASNRRASSVAYRILYSNNYMTQDLLPVTEVTETTQKWMFISARQATEVVMEFKRRGVF